MTTARELVVAWREMGPAAWAESDYGWVLDHGQSITLTPWQRAVLLAWWRWRAEVRTLGLSLNKKTGKTLTNGLLLAWRWLALPGQHFAVGNDLDQAAGRQFAEIAAMVKRHPYLARNCKVDKRRIEFKPTGSTIEALPADASGNAGANHLTASHTEAWGVMLEQGIRAWEELTPPPMSQYPGFPPMRIADSYAGYEGDSNTWHALVDMGLSGELVDDHWPIYFSREAGLMLFHIEGEEARERCFPGTAQQAAVYYASERRTLRTMAWQRFHENQRSSGQEQFITEDDWRAIEDPSLKPLMPTKAVPVYVGLDLAIKKDNAAAVAACPNGRRLARLAFHKIWKPGPGREIDLNDVAAYLRGINERYWLVAVYYDPSQAQMLAQTLRRDDKINMVEVPQSLPELGPRGVTLWEAIRDQRLTVYPSEEMKAAALAAQAREVPQGLHIKKQKASRKIDPIVALSFCLPAAIESQGIVDWSSVEDLGHVEGYASPWVEPSRLDNWRHSKWG